MHPFTGNRAQDIGLRAARLAQPVPVVEDQPDVVAIDRLDQLPCRGQRRQHGPRQPFDRQREAGIGGAVGECRQPGASRGEIEFAFVHRHRQQMRRADEVGEREQRVGFFGECVADAVGPCDARLRR